MKQYLFIMLGYPGSGKSHFARQLAESIKAVRLNGDGARHLMFAQEEMRSNPANNPMVFGALDYATEQILHAGYSVVYDASHNKLSDRLKSMQLGKPFNIIPITIWMDISVELARQRQQSRELKPDQPRVPPNRFEELVANLVPPQADEKYIKIDGTADFVNQLASFNSQLNEMQ